MEIYTSIAQSLGTDAGTVRMALSVGIFAVAYLLIAFNLVEKLIAVLAGVLATFLLRLVSFGQASASVDLNVLFLLIGMMACTELLGETGFFEWVVVGIARKAKGNAVMILAGLMLSAMLLSSFVDNAACVILMAPLTIMITQLLEVPTAPFLVFVALAANIGGAATFIGSPPNMIIGSRAGLSFNDFLMHMAPAALLAGVALMSAAVLGMGRRLRISAHVRTRVINAHPDLAITDPGAMRVSLAVLALILLGLLLQGQIHVEAGMTALCGMGLMLFLRHGSAEKVLARVDWGTILVLAGLFILAGSLEANGAVSLVAGEIVSLCGGGIMPACMAIMWGSAILSAALGNIPLAVAMAPMACELVEKTGGDPHSASPLYWALAIGVSLGGNGTLFGSAANAAAARIGGENGCPISYRTFLLHGFPPMTLSLVVCSIYFYLRYG